MPNDEARTETTSEVAYGARDPDELKTTPWAKELREALALEAAAGWYFYNEETRKRLGEEKARLDINLVLRALARAGLTLERKPNFAVEERAYAKASD